MNYLTLLLVFSGLFLTTTADKPDKINFENLTDVDPEFVQFLSAFDKSTLPLEMNLNDIENFHEKPINYNRNENQILLRFLDKESSSLSKISRMGPPTITPMHRFYPSKKTIAVTYATKQNYKGASAFIYMAIFNLKGKLLSIKESKEKRYKLRWENPISTNTLEQSETFRITEEGLVYKNTYDKIWKKDLKKFGFENNEVLKTELVSQETLQIQEDGSLTSVGKTNSFGFAAVAGRAE